MRIHSIRIAGLLALMTVLLLGSVQSAWAAGWWRENANDTINQVANNGADAYNVLWSDAVSNPKPDSGWDYNTPHKGYSATSNRCKTCHAVHGALQQSFRLLKNESRVDECNYCHMGPAGASQLRLYTLDDLGFTVKGEHTLGSTNVPDSNINGGVDNGKLPDRGGPYDDSGNSGLYCYSCHSVHGANTIQDVNTWEEKILRNDPAMNGGNAEDGLQTGINGSVVTREDGVTLDLSDIPNSRVKDGNGKTGSAEIKKAFCGDCHNKNYNFRVNMELSDDGSFDVFGTGVTETAGKDYSLTRGSHPMNDNQWLDIGGGAGQTGYVQVSGTGFTVSWCGDCHTASGELEYGNQTAGSGGDPWNSAWKVVGFPHQSKGNKFFAETYTAGDRDATQTNDAYEAIDEMDGQVCLQCHDFGGGQGVGETF